MGFLWRRVVGYLVFLTVLGFLSILIYWENAASGGMFLTGTQGLAISIAVLFAALLASWTTRAAMRSRDRAHRREVRRRYR